jgi:hypothetical protein
MALKRLTHERFARMRMRDEFPPLPPEPEPLLPAAPPPLTRGGEPQHPRWPRVMAMVREGDVLNWHFVAEAPDQVAAIVLCAHYRFRAVVTDASGKRLFDNWKTVENAT